MDVKETFSGSGMETKCESSSMQVQSEIKRRLVIRTITLENFKSYGGRVRIGPLHRQFNATVGPNGSGKSNIIDAILFVFGKRAKQMRSNKVSELIHRSEAYSEASQATVTIDFAEIVDREYASEDDPDEDIDGSEFTVSRTATRSNVSSYFLNGEAATYTEVQRFLRDKGIDLDNNRFLILQGEVEQISLMKPKASTPHETGLLEYLEDIIGSNALVAPIEEATKELEELNEERTVRLNRLKAVDKEREALEEAKFEAEQYIVLEHDIHEKRMRLHDAQAERLAQTAAEYESKHNQTKAQLEVERGQHAEAEAQVQILLKRQTEAKQELNELEKALAALREEFTELERRDVRIREEHKHLVQREKKITGTIRAEEHRRTEQERAREAAQNQIRDLQNARLRITKELEESEAALQNVYESLRDKTADLRSEMERKQTELLPIRETADMARQRLCIALQRLQLLESKRLAPELELKAAEELAAKLEKEHDEAHSQIENHLKPGANAAKDALNRAESALQAARQTEEAARKELSRLRRLAEEASASLADTSGRSRMLNTLWEAARRGAIRGFVGRLGDLGDVPPPYGAALEAAAGGALDHLVVEDVDDAQACIELLRDHKLGRATFIILSKIQHLQPAMEQNNYPAPENVPRLFDLLQVPNGPCRLPFYFVLRNTLVARDLEQATRIAFQPTRRNRVVTQAGQLIETSGTMCGGGGGDTGSSRSRSAVRRNVPGSDAKQAGTDPNSKFGATSVSTETLAKAEKTAAAAIATLAEGERKRDTCMEHLRSANQALERTRLELSSIDQRLGDTKAQVRLLRQQSAKQALTDEESNELRHLEAHIPQLERECAQADAAAAELEVQIQKHQERILAVGGKRLEQARSAVAGLRETLDANTQALGSAQIAMESALETLNKAVDAIQGASAERKKLEEQREQRDAELGELERQAATILQAQHELDQNLKEKQNVLQQIQTEIGRHQNALQSWRRRELEITSSLEKLASELQRAQAQVQEHRHQAIASRQSMLEIEESMPLLFAEDSAAGDEELHDSAKDENDDEHQSESEVAGSSSLAEQTDGRTRRGRRRRMSSAPGSKALLDTIERLELEIVALEQSLAQLKPNLNAIDEYRKKEEEYRVRMAELDTLTERRDGRRRELDELRKRRLETFMTGFAVITTKLKEMYQMITLGGDAELELIDSLDPFSEGIVFTVRPPKKTWKNIANLSGGEKTLSSLALVFALHHYKPTPFYVMDEIDAALDFKNVSIVAHYIHERARDAQFFIISLRNDMFELASRLVGVYKIHHTSYSVALDPGAVVALPGDSVQAPLEKENRAATQLEEAGDKELSPRALASLTTATKASGIRDASYQTFASVQSPRS
ncbi:Structural maintenance of chromosomes protein 4 [Cyanidiococcus yangmingshanensis]|uniref:Structural maintenance of chromosomes protein n=1 Tax=Cyanidiococcus yangmingshanensis TaxID=2690220 RepID=A0A7J7IQP4_9RHOD|nr:Structural maintenance of chromosomes protein 4 [Cyanidiococcus yangmingshanensis]